MGLTKNKGLTGLTVIMFFIAATFAVISGAFNMQGGYILGSLLNEEMGQSLKWGMALIELQIFMLPLLGLLIYTGKLQTLLIKTVSYGLSVFCLTYAISTGLNNTALDSATSGTDSSIIDAEITTINDEINIINQDIALLKQLRTETSDKLKKSSPRAVQLIDAIKREKSLISDGALCPSDKWKTRCNNIKRYQSELDKISASVHASALDEIDQKIQNSHREANKLSVSINEKQRLRLNQETQTQNKATIFKYKPSEMSSEQFSVIIALFIAISMEIVKYGATLQFWKLGIGRLPSSLRDENNPQNERLASFETKRKSGVWLKRLTINLFRHRVSRGARIEEKTAEKLAEKKLKIEAEKEKLEAKVSDGRAILHNMTYDQAKSIIDQSYLPGGMHRTKADDVINATVLVLRTYRPHEKWIADDATRLLKTEHHWLTYAMMRDWVKPILIDDLMLLNKTGRCTSWVDNWEVTRRIFRKLTSDAA